MWDAEVDVAVLGAGIGGLANAVAVADAGGEVLVFDLPAPSGAEVAHVAVRERVGSRRRHLLPVTLDVETNHYLAALVEGLVTDADSDDTVLRRDAHNLSREEVDGRRVDTFFGSRLHGWAQKCVTSPYGLLYTSMRNWPTTTMRSADGELVEVLSVGTMDWADGFGEHALRQWVCAQARGRDVDVRTATQLERIVFEEGVVAGVVLQTPDGLLAVRTRFGITMAPSDGEALVEAPADAAAGDRLQVCLVGRIASRFGRVELLSTEPATARPACAGSRHQLREGMHEARQPALEGWRCGKVHGYPTFGQ